MCTGGMRCVVVWCLWCCSCFFLLVLVYVGAANGRGLWALGTRQNDAFRDGWRDGIWKDDGDAGARLAHGQ